MGCTGWGEVFSLRIKKNNIINIIYNIRCARRKQLDEYKKLREVTLKFEPIKC